MNQQLKALGVQFDAPVNSVCFSLDGSQIAYGLGNGTIHLSGDARKTVQVHKGTIPALYAYDEGFISLSDDGTVKLISPDGDVKDFADFKGAWIDRMAVHANGSVAVPVGKNIHLWTKRDAEPRIIGPHPASVTDVCFAPDGLGLVASHRDGITLWAWPHFEPQSIHMPWKGAHLAITISADKRWIVTAMQEGALHMWNVPLKRDYQMRGYWGKPTAMAWTPDRKWLATSGAESVIIWPFDKGGPEGREAIQLGWSNGTLVSALAAHPDDNVIAAGFEDGAVVLLDVRGKKAYTAAQPGKAPITAIAFSPDGTGLVAGSAGNAAVRFDFTT